MSTGIEVFGRRVPRRAIIGFVGDDAQAISSELQGASDTGKPGDLIVDYSLDLLDPLSRLRSRRDLTAARHRGATILLASYREELLEELCDELWWIDDGNVRAQGDPAEVLDQWKQHTLAVWREEQQGVVVRMTPALTAGDGRAHVQSVELLDAEGIHVGGWKSGEPASVRTVIVFAQPVENPVIGILIRTRIGLSVYGTNTELERLSLGPRAPQDQLTLTFRFVCHLCPGEYTLTVASHDHDGVWHEWLDDVIAFTVADVRYTAGVANLRAAVEWTLGGGRLRTTKELLTQAYVAFNRRDIDGVLALMSADVNWPNLMDGVRAVGKDEVRAYWTNQWKVVDPRVEPVNIDDDETGKTVVDVHQVVRDLDGKVLSDQIVQHVYSIENGLITGMDVRAGS